METLTLKELPTIETIEAAPTNFFLSDPFLIVWSDQIDIWRFEDETDALRHVATLSEYVEPPSSYNHKPNVVIDTERDLLALPESPYSGPAKYWIFRLSDGEHIRSVGLYGSMADVHFPYRDGRALPLLIRQDSNVLHSEASIVLCDLTGEGGLLGGVDLPKDLADRAQHLDIPPLILHPVFLSGIGGIVSTSTHKWLGKVDLLRWNGPEIRDEQQPDARLELLPALQDPQCRSMLPTCHVPINSTTFVLCTYEDYFQNWEATPNWRSINQTSITAYDASTMTATWKAKAIAGEVKHIEHVPSLEVIIVSGYRDVTPHEENRVSLKHEYFVAALESSTGLQLALHTFDSDTQDSLTETIGVTSDPNRPDLVVVWSSGEVAIVSVRSFIDTGFEREGSRVRTAACFPPDVSFAAIGRRSIVARAGVKNHPVISEGCSESDLPDWEEEEGKVMMATW